MNLLAWAPGAWASGAWGAGTWQGIDDPAFTSSYGPHPAFLAEQEPKKRRKRKASRPDGVQEPPRHYERILPPLRPALNAAALMDRAEADTRAALKRQLRAQALEEDEWLLLA